jgi:peptidoglycan/LPS O-acetylase OafA/YrhL
MLLVMFIPVALTTSLKSGAGGSAFALFYLMPIGLEGGFQTASAYAHARSLGVEEWFYFLWPAALIPLAKLTSGANVVLGTAAALITAAGVLEAMTGHSSYILRAYGLLAGCWLALTLERGWKPPRWFGVGGVLMLTAAAVWTTDASLSTPGKVLADAGAMMLIARMTSDGNVSIAQILSWRPIVYLGKIS